MKRVIILLIAVSSFAFAGGEISFKKQNEKQRRIENAQLEAIKNNIQPKGNVVIEENIEPGNTGSIFEDEEILNPLKKKTAKYEKLVNYIKTQNNRLSDQEIRYILDTVWRYSNEYKMNPYLILAVMNTESHFNHSTVSKAGARGLMQLMPFNFREFNVNNSIEGNIKGGILHLKRDYEKTGSITKTLICYNAGCGRLKNDEWKEIQETREYIPKVIKKYKKILSL
jgi:SPBc2 prophage-derived uncharacterized transglycosylase yomI